MKLTQPLISKLDAGPKARVVFDDAQPGFGVRLYPGGRKVFVVEYRQAGAGRAGSKRRVTIGDTNVLTLATARERARELLAQVRLGADPMTARRQAKAEATFAAIATDWLTHVKSNRKPRTGVEYEKIVRKHLVPTLGSKSVKTVSRADVRRVFDSVTKSGSPIIANRVLAVVSSMWTWAARRDIVGAERNPTEGIERNRETARERYLTDVEMTRLGLTLKLAETTGLPWKEPKGSVSKHLPKAANRVTRLSPFVTAAIRLLILTGARLSEILNLRWDEIDTQRGLAFLADSKTGRKPLILSDAAVDLLKSLPREVGSPYVIPGENGEARFDLRKPWLTVTRHAKLEGLRIHDLRHSAASLMAGAGNSLTVIGAVLGHTQPATTQRYAHVALSPARKAVDGLAAHLQGLGIVPDTPAKQ